MKKARFSKLVVSFIVLANCAFTAAALFVFLRTGLEPTALIAAWFAFTTGELAALAGLRHSENKSKQDKEGGK
jgi:hydrogenase-4 membrane subunit HyfE